MDTRPPVRLAAGKLGQKRHAYFCGSRSNAATIRNDTIVGILTGSKKLTGSQLSLPHGINKKKYLEGKVFVENKTKVASGVGCSERTVLYFTELLFKSNKKFSFRRDESEKISSHPRRDLL